MKPALPPSVTSTSDLASLILEINTYAQWYRQSSNAARVGARYTVEAPELSETATTLIRDWSNHTPLTLAQLEMLVTELEAIAKSAPTVTITLSAPAPTEVREALVAWVRTNIHADTLVTLRFNATIVGGMVVRRGSKIYDWSWRRILLERRRSFAEVLARV